MSKRILVAAAFVAGMACGGLVRAGLGLTQSEEVTQAIHVAAQRHGVSEAWLRRVAWCESRYVPWARNARSGAAGLFQFMPRTWAWMSAQAGRVGANVYDAWAASDVAAWAFRNGYAGHWACR